MVVFSDNLFICGNVDGQIHWQSWDGKKMETCHTPVDFDYYFEVFTRKSEFTDENDKVVLRSVFNIMT